jgi:hypothetical protein
MRPDDEIFENGRSYGKHEILEKLRIWAESTNNSRVLEIISNAIYNVEDKVNE